MSKTWTLRLELQRLFETLTTKVYYEGTQEPGKYLYLVFELNEVSYADGKTLMQLEVNIFDYGTNKRVVDDLADMIQEILNKYYFINNEIQFVVYKGLRQKVEENDKEIIRRRLLFEIQLHELKGE